MKYKPREIKDYDRKKLICDLHDSGLNHRQIAEKLGCSKQNVSDTLVKYYTKIMNKPYIKEYRFVGTSKRINTNLLFEKFKKIDNPEQYSKNELCKLLGCTKNQLQWIKISRIKSEFKFKRNNMIMDKKLKFIFVGISIEMKNKLIDYSKQNDMSISAICRNAIEEYLKGGLNGNKI